MDPPKTFNELVQAIAELGCPNLALMVEGKLKIPDMHPDHRRILARNRVATSYSPLDSLHSRRDRTPPYMLKAAIAELGGTNLVWLTEETLMIFDTSPHYRRLMLVGNKGVVAELEKYMIAEEKEVLVYCKKLNVMVVDRSGNQFELRLEKWSNNYVLTGINWNRLVQAMELKSYDMVQLWCFRLPAEQSFRLPAEQASKLCFAINVIKAPEYD